MRINHIFLTVFVLIAIISCKKNSQQSKADQSLPSGVLIIGMDSSNAVIWEDGHKTVLDTFAEARSIDISGGNVAISGTLTRYPDQSAVYWINGVRNQLTYGKVANVGQVKVLGSDVYVAGDILGVDSFGTNVTAAYWKNRDVNYLSGYASASARGIEVVGTDVFVGGIFYNQGLTDTGAVVWKNGLPKPYNSDGEIPYLKYHEPDLYKVYNNVSNASFFVNDIQQPINSEGGTSSIFIDGNDVYLVGQYSDPAYQTSTSNRTYACYWKNGTLHVITSKYSQSSAAALIVLDGHVIVVGQAFDNFLPKATCWIDDNEVRLSENGVAYGVASLQ